MIIKKIDKDIQFISLSHILKKSINNKKLDSDLCNFVKMEDITNKINNSIIKEYKDVKSGFTKFNYSDILIAKITPCFENGKGALVNLKDGGFGSTEFMVLTPINELVKDFVYHVTQSNKLRTLGEPLMVGGGGQRRIPKEFILNYEIPQLADIEYFKIGSFLNKQSQRIDKIKNLLEKIEIRNQYYADKILDGTLSIDDTNNISNQTLMPVEIKIEDIVNDLPKSKLDAKIGSKKGEYRFFKSSAEEYWSDDFIYDTEAIVMADGGRANVDYYNGKFSTSNHVYVFNSQIVNNKYFYYLLKSNIHLIDNCFQGAALKNLSKKQFKQLQFNIFKDSEYQIKIVNFLDKLNNEKEKVEKLLKLEEQRFEWLSDKLLSGEYVIEGNNDVI